MIQFSCDARLTPNTAPLVSSAALDAAGAEARESDQRGRSGVFALMGVLVLVVGLIVAGRAIVVGLALRTVFTSVVPSPAIAMLPIDVAAGVAELPCLLLLDPLALASLIPIVLVGPEQAGR